jgi:hypothetical protein
MQKQRFWFILAVIGLFLLSLNFAGCATSKGTVAAVTPLKEDVSLTKYDNLLIEVQNNNNVQLTASDKERILMQSIAAIKKDYPARFKSINEGGPTPSTLKAVVNITRYDKGNAFARSMLAGLGQIVINGDVTMYDSVSNEALSRCEATKRFAWGGLYGATTTIETVEEGFVKAVANCIAGAMAGAK